MTDTDDLTAHAYLRLRNGIARRHRLTLLDGELPCDAWGTAHKKITVDVRNGDVAIIAKFDRAAANFAGGCYADDGYSLGLWRTTKKETVQMFKDRAEKMRASVGTRALFHPGYLPVGRHKGWPYLRAQNPNPSPYNSAHEWLWTMNVKPGLDVSRVRPVDFFIGVAHPNGGRSGVTAEVKVSDTQYDLPMPYVTTQKRLDRVIDDALCFADKLAAVHARHVEAGLQGSLLHTVSAETRKRLWL